MPNSFQQRIGVGERQYLYGRHVGKRNKTHVIADDGPNRGRPVGSQTEHWDGRVDATVRPTTVAVKVSPSANPKGVGFV